MAARVELTSNSQQQLLIARLRKHVFSKVRKVGSKGAVLVAVWAFLVYTACAGIGKKRFPQFGVEQWRNNQPSIIACVVAALLGPAVGLVASTYFGRYKTMCTSLWLMWTAAITDTIVVVVLNSLTVENLTLPYSVVVIAEIIFSIGLTAFTVNAIPFGLDQMPDASAEEITAFIHWYIWSAMAGILTSLLSQTVTLYLMISISNSVAIHSLCSAVMLTTSLCTILLLRHWLIIEPESSNPVRTIFKVLMFAAKNKVPVRRSAFTYWESDIPSRIDLGKSKYGGPFTTEEVEDVKTFLRMIVVVASASIAVISFAAFVSTYNITLHLMVEYSAGTSRDFMQKIVLFLFLSVILSLPVYDLFIRPLIRMCIETILKRVGLALALNVCVSLILLITTIIWYTSTSPHQCIITSSHVHSPLTIDYGWIVVPTELITYSFIFFFTVAMMEFACAQAPYNLRGLVIGITQAILITIFIVTCIVLVIIRQHVETNDPMCGMWFYLLITVVAILGLVIWCVVAKWYKKREREEPEMCRVMIEDIYDRLTSHNQRTSYQ